MLELLQDMTQDIQFSPEMTGLSVLVLGILIAVYGVTNAFAGQRVEVRRLHGGTAGRAVGADFDLVRGDDNDTHGLLRAFVPSSRNEKTRVRHQLRQAGIQSQNSVAVYYFVRSLLGIGLPLLFIGGMYLPAEVQSQYNLERIFVGRSMAEVLYIVTVLAAIGFYGPYIWLKRKIAARQQRIWETLPNALDLLQVSVEAGLGFDAAIVRVSHELAGIAPDIASEFMMLQLEIGAGKDKQKAYLDMADRSNVEEMASFANVILQAGQYGTSISTVLTAYSDEMRVSRELKAQEKANRLPVQMSGVIAVTMMPALLIICLAPMLIRWIRLFG